MKSKINEYQKDTNKPLLFFCHRPSERSRRVAQEKKKKQESKTIRVLRNKSTICVLQENTSAIQHALVKIKAIFRGKKIKNPQWSSYLKRTTEHEQPTTELQTLKR
jgi:chlorite dismutase